MYGKLGIFAFAAWAGTDGNGVVVGLAMCGVLLAACSTASTLMQVGVGLVGRGCARGCGRSDRLLSPRSSAVSEPAVSVWQFSLSVTRASDFDV